MEEKTNMINDVEGGAMSDLTSQEARDIIKRDLDTIKNPRILEQLLDILGYGNKVADFQKEG